MTNYIETNYDEETQWGFLIQSSVDKCDDQAEEMLKRLSGLFDAFGEFIIPTEVNVSCHTLSENQPMSKCLTEATSSTLERKTIRSEEGIKESDIHKNIQEYQDRTTYIHGITIDRNKVKIELESGIHYLGCDDSQYGYPETSQSSDQVPLWEPINPKKLIHNDWEAGVKEGYPFSYWLPVGIHSDIWFEDSELGQRNRENLTNFLEAIESNLPVFRVDREPGLHTVEQLKSVY